MQCMHRCTSWGYSTEPLHFLVDVTTPPQLFELFAIRSLLIASSAVHLHQSYAIFRDLVQCRYKTIAGPFLYGQDQHAIIGAILAE